MKKTLKERLYSYLKRNPGFHAKGNLADMARDSDLKATGEATGRRLRELAEDGLIQVEIRRGHAYYRFDKENSTEAVVERMEIYWNSLPARLEQ